MATIDLEPGVPTLAVPCPNCLAAPNEPCTRPAASGRTPSRTLHFARIPRESYPSRYAFGTPDAGEGFGAAL